MEQSNPPAKVTGKRNRKEPETLEVKMLRGISTSRTDYRRCCSVLAKLMADPVGRFFNGLQGSVGSRNFELMDFDSVKSNLDGGKYASAEEFAGDINLTLRTAMEYSASLVGKEVNRLAVEVLDMFEIEWRGFRKDDNEKEETIRRCTLEAEMIPVNEINDGSDRSCVSEDYRYQDPGSHKGSSLSVKIKLARRPKIEMQREEARRKIESMKNTAGFTDNLDSMLEFEKLLMKGQIMPGQYVKQQWIDMYKY